MVTTVKSIGNIDHEVYAHPLTRPHTHSHTHTHTLTHTLTHTHGQCKLGTVYIVCTHYTVPYFLTHTHTHTRSMQIGHSVHCMYIYCTIFPNTHSPTHSHTCDRYRCFSVEHAAASKTKSAEGFIDGDLIEQFLDLPHQKMEDVCNGIKV